MRFAYVFISPFYLLFLVFGLFPLLWSFYLTFQDWNGLGPMTGVGLGNYRALLRDSTFLEALVNTTLYWIVDVALVLVLALVLATLLQNVWLRGRGAYRVAGFIPYVTATVAVGLVFVMVFDQNSGLLNSLLKQLGIPAQPWLNSTGLSKVPVMVLSIWRETPWYLLIIFAGLQGINPELYEAATVDGANPIQRFFSITIPSIAPILFFCFITCTIDSFRIFTEPYILTGGGPGASSLSIVQYLYRSGFTVFKLGYAATIGYALTVILILISAAQLIGLRNQSALNEAGIE
jgi:ABC-type sugar transport system permease subunit